MSQVCEVCGKTNVELVPLVNPHGTNEIHWICRHGHIDAWTIDPLTGLPMRLTADDFEARQSWRKTKVLDDSTPMQLEPLALSPKEEILKKLRGKLTE